MPLYSCGNGPTDLGPQESRGQAAGLHLLEEGLVEFGALAHGDVFEYVQLDGLVGRYVLIMQSPREAHVRRDGKQRQV